MVMRRFPCLHLFPAPSSRAADEVGAAVQIHAGHANLGEAELIGAIVKSSVRELVRLHRAPLPPGDGLDNLVETGLSETHDGHVARAAPNVDPVDVDGRSKIARRNGRMLG